MPQQVQRGFSLIELLVVVFIVGILITLATLAISNQEHKRIDNEVSRVHMLLSHMRQEAILKDKQFALRIRADAYEFLALDAEGEWQLISDDDMFKSHELDDDLEYRIDTDNSDEEGAVITILSSGEMSPFTLILMSSDGRYQQTLKGDSLGHLTRERARDE